MVHPPSRNFVIAAHPRTGTNFLCNIIHHRGDIAYLGEYYPEPPVCDGNYLVPLFNGEAGDMVRSPFKDQPADAKGQCAKVFYYYWVYRTQDEYGFSARWDVLQYMKESHIGVVHLRRENILDTALSFALSMRDMTFVQQDYKGPINLTPQDLEGYMWRVLWQSDSMDKALNIIGPRRLDLWYGQMTARPQEAADQIADFLQRPRKEIKLSEFMVRQRRGSQSKYLENYDELKAHFKDTYYGQFFED